MSELSPEMQLLCACCRVKPRAEDLQLQAALATQIHADKLIAAAIRQRVEPLLYHNLKQHAQGVFSDQVMEALAARVRRNAINSLNAIRINLQLVRMLRERGIPFLPMKGITLAQRYYGEIGLRHTKDIDFWVPVEFVKTVRDLLMKQGCQPHYEHDIRWALENDKLRRIYPNHLILSDPCGMHLEMHWRFTLNSETFKLDAAEMLACGETVEVAGEAMTMMAPVQLLLYLCMHGARHGWWRLKWLLDLPQVLESRDWDWPLVLAEAKRANCLNALRLGLKLAEQLFGWVVPEQVAASMSKQYLLNWQMKIVFQYLGKPEESLTKLTFTEKIYRLSLAESASFFWEDLYRRWFSMHYGQHSRLLARQTE